MSPKDADGVDRDPLGLRIQGGTFLVAVPVFIVILIVKGGPWYAYVAVVAFGLFIWLVVFKFNPWWFDWVRGTDSK